MELKDTIEMMNSEDYKEGFKAEYYQLDIRMKKLRDVLEKHKAGTLPFKLTCDYDMLLAQYVYMVGYLSYLQCRAEIEDIEL